MTDPNCVFCKKENLDVLYETANTVCVQVKIAGEPVRGAFFVITKEHVLPDEPTEFNFRNEAIECRSWLVASGLALSIDNTSVNLTGGGGLQVTHLHEWQFDRQTIDRDFSTKFQAQLPPLGMYGLMGELAATSAFRW